MKGLQPSGGSSSHDPLWVALRIVWVLVAGLSAALCLAGIWARFAQLDTICRDHCSPGFGNPLTASMVRALHHDGLSLPFYAAYSVAIESGLASVWLLLSALLFWRTSRGHDRMAIFVALMLLSFGALSSNLPDALAQAHPAWQGPVSILDALALASLTIFLFVFPDGRFVPHWTRVGAVVTVAAYVALFLPATHLSPQNTVVGLAAELLLFLTGLVCQVYRYRRISTPMQRQQTKWVMLGVALPTALLLANVVTPLGSSRNPLMLMAEDTLFCLFGAGIPITIGIALVRYRLWDVDLLINRTLVYVILSAALGLVYFGSVVLLQVLVRLLTGQGSALVVALSTLGIAALFGPLRRHIQAGVDRRFYRRKYDASKTLTAFSASVRDQVDLDGLAESLVSVVRESMQPVHVSLWLPDHGSEAKA